MNPRKYQLFSVRDDELFYLKEPLTRQVVADTQRVLDSHVVSKRTERALYERIIFCIASQFLTYERVCEYIAALRDEPLKNIKDPKILLTKASQLNMRFKRSDDRYSPVVNFIENYDGGIEKLADDILSNPKEMRDKLNKEVNWIAYKTASFIHMCFGGIELMTLDVHNLRQIAGIGIDMDPKYYEGTLRKSGLTKDMRIQVTPSEKQYRRIEAETLEKLASLNLRKKFPEFRGNNGDVNAAFVTSLFWWAGAQARRRGKDFFQGWLIEPDPPKFESPFSE